MSTCSQRSREDRVLTKFSVWVSPVSFRSMNIDLEKVSCVWVTSYIGHNSGCVIYCTGIASHIFSHALLTASLHLFNWFGGSVCFGRLLCWEDIRSTVSYKMHCLSHLSTMKVGQQFPWQVLYRCQCFCFWAYTRCDCQSKPVMYNREFRSSL